LLLHRGLSRKCRWKHRVRGVGSLGERERAGGGPSALRKTIMRTELFASINVMSIQGKSNADDFRTQMIQDLKRHFIGLRLYFN
jgi:hypothetical protein